MGQLIGERAQRLVAWCTLALVLVSVLALGSNRPVAWSLLALFVTGLFCLQILVDMSRGIGKEGTRLWLVALLYLGVLGWALVQILPGLLPDQAHPSWETVSGLATISADPGNGWHHVMRLLTYGMVFWIALRSCEDRERAFALLALVALFTGALAAYGIYAYLAGDNILLPPGSRINVVSASFINRNSYATYALIGTLAALALFARHMTASEAIATRSRLRDAIETFFERSWIYALCLLLGIGAIALTQSRAGAAAALIALLVFWLGFRSRESANPMILGAILLVLGAVVFSASTGVVNRILTTSDEQNRFEVYGAIIAGLEERPLVGHGLGAFEDTFRAHVPETVAVAEWDMAHNSYLENAWELGLPAAGVFYLALLLIGWRVLRGLRERRRDRMFGAAVMAMMLGCGFHAVFDFGLQMPATAALFAWMLGMGWSQSFSGRDGQGGRKKKRRRRSGSSSKGGGGERPAAEGPKPLPVDPAEPGRLT